MFYIFLQFYLTSLREKEYFAKEPEPELGVFGPLEPEPEPLEKKYQEPEPGPEPLKNLPAPQPWKGGERGKREEKRVKGGKKMEKGE